MGRGLLDEIENILMSTPAAERPALQRDIEASIKAARDRAARPRIHSDESRTPALPRKGQKCVRESG
jgi:hypothetical protein